MVKDNQTSNNYLLSIFDCVVILCLEENSQEFNLEEYQFTKKLFDYLPIVYIVPDLNEKNINHEILDNKTIILHVYKLYGEVQSSLIRRFMVESYFIKPIVWIHNILFIDFIINGFSSLKVFHPTKEFRKFDFSSLDDNCFNNILNTTLYISDVLISKSDKIRNSYLVNTFHKLPSFSLESVNILDIYKILCQTSKDNLSKNKEDIDILKPHFNVLILYDTQSIHVNTVREHLESFKKFSKCHINYAPATGFVKPKISLQDYDIIVVHYCIRVNINNYLSPYYSQALKDFSGYKVLFIQDEYDTTEIARVWIRDIGIHAVFTCIPSQYINQIYPYSRFPMVEFIPTLTGFVPQCLESGDDLQTFKVTPTSERHLSIVYRGRKLPYWYGDLGQEKLEIGLKMKQICLEKSIDNDIECDDSKRIYGDSWYDFLSSGKATLGTESGSNIFDEFGNIRANIELALKKNPQMSYVEARNLFFKEDPKKVKMNQISPKMFEAIALKTALILFEGEYSGILKPDTHYISLKKDFSNIDSVLSKLQDPYYLERLVETAYTDIVASGKYSYQQFINEFDRFLLEHLPIKKERPKLLTESSLLLLINSKLYSFKLLIISIFNNPVFYIRRLFLLPKLIKLKLQSFWFKLKQIIKKNLQKIRQKQFLQ